jgi:uncharacterized protein YacL
MKKRVVRWAAHILRWVRRILGAFSIAFTIYLTIGLIVETLISNMDRAYAVMTCAAIIVAAVVAVRTLYRVYFPTSTEPPAPDLTINVTVEQASASEAAASGGERQTEQAAGKVMWV